MRTVIVSTIAGVILSTASLARAAEVEVCVEVTVKHPEPALAAPAAAQSKLADAPPAAAPPTAAPPKVVPMVEEGEEGAAAPAPAPVPAPKPPTAPAIDDGAESRNAAEMAGNQLPMGRRLRSISSGWSNTS